MTALAQQERPVVAALPQNQRATVIVVGNGMVGHRFCERLTSAPAATPGYRILVFGDEPTPAYDRIRLTSVFQGVAPQSLQLASANWYQERGIQLRLGDPVVAVDSEAQTVRTASGLLEHYDHLVLATGAEPRVPPVEGLSDPGIFLYRNLRDAAGIREAARTASSAVVVGGGLLGLEAAQALKDLKLQVFIIEAAAFLMPRQMDPDGGLELGKAIRARGINVQLGRRMRSVRKHGQRWVIEFEEVEAQHADMVVLAAGVRAADDLAREAGVFCGPGGGVVVNERLQSSVPNVYAIGDCALFKGNALGLVAPGYEMAEVLAARLLDQPRVYAGRPTSTRLKVAGVDVSVLGDFASNSAHPVVAHVTSGYRKLLVQRGVIVGAAAVGPWPERDRIERAIADKQFLWRWTLRRFPKRGLLWPDEVEERVADWPDTATVCHCVNVSCGRLRTLVANGCNTVSGLSEQTAAGTVCGSCKPTLQELVGEEQLSSGRVLAKGLLKLSVVAAVVLALHLLLPKISLANTINGPWWEVLWRNDLARQISGFSLLGLIVLALTFSLRKRWFPRWGRFEWWRAAHAVLGIATLVGLAVHTGMSKGQNFNALLYWDFLLINLLGAGAGSALSLRARTRKHSLWQRRLRWLHVALFAPLPVLIAFHILTVYYY